MPVAGVVGTGDGFADLACFVKGQSVIGTDGAVIAGYSGNYFVSLAAASNDSALPKGVRTGEVQVVDDVIAEVLCLLPVFIEPPPAKSRLRDSMFSRRIRHSIKKSFCAVNQFNRDRTSSSIK